jgi:hypothetical protein
VSHITRFAARSAGRPLLDDHAEIVQPLDNGFDIAADLRAVFAVGER